MIKNGKNTPLNQASGNVPNVASAMLDWFQKLTFTRIVKTIVNFEVVEMKTSFSCQGVIQVMSAEQLRMKPDGQTSWKWYTVHAEPTLSLDVDEVITYFGTGYRVMGKSDYSLYGYVLYELVQDYKP